LACHGRRIRRIARFGARCRWSRAIERFIHAWIDSCTRCWICSSGIIVGRFRRDNRRGRIYRCRGVGVACGGSSSVGSMLWSMLRMAGIHCVRSVQADKVPDEGDSILQRSWSSFVHHNGEEADVPSTVVPSTSTATHKQCCNILAQMHPRTSNDPPFERTVVERKTKNRDRGKEKTSAFAPTVNHTLYDLPGRRQPSNLSLA